MKKLLKYPTMVLFFGFIAIFMISDILAPKREFSELENRTLSKNPTLTKTNLFATQEDSKYTYLYEQYVNDQFLFRDNWISLKSKSEAALLKTENNSIIYGDEGTMFQKFYTVNDKQFKKNTKAVAEFMSRHKDLVNVMVVPSASAVSENAPIAPFADETEYFAQMQIDFAENGEFIDLREVYNNGEKDAYDFYKTDHHWTTQGAYKAYEEYSKTVDKGSFSLEDYEPTEVEGFFGTLYSKAKLYNAVPDTLSYYDEIDNKLTITQGATKADAQIAADAGIKDIVVDLYDETKLEERDKYAAFLYGNNGFSRVEGDGEGRVLVIKDSYANAFIPFLTADYEQIDVIDLRSLKTGVDKIIEENEYDDILVLYNFQSFQEDGDIVKLNLFNG